MRIIMLIDMDYFFVACEELRHPEIKDVPAIVGSDPKGGDGRGAVMTCNYKARELGIRSGMPISTAYRLKPDAVFLALDYAYYEELSKRIMEVVKGFADRFEQVSIDEAFIDVSRRLERFGDAQDYAFRIKRSVLEKVGLKCSIGVGPNKLIAKMACEKAKPDGIKVVEEKDVMDFIGKLKVDKLYGVGTKTSEKLEAMGYRTVEELSKANMMDMVDKFGAFGTELVRYANGIDESEVTENYEVKSISREFTFEKDTDNDKQIIDEINKLGDAVITDVNKGQIYFKTITLKLRYKDFTEHLHSRSVKVTNDAKTLHDATRQLYMENVDKSRKVRKIGVRVSNLVSYKGQKRIA